MAKAQMSIGQPITTMPAVRRKHKTATRMGLLQKALGKVTAGMILPVYCVSNMAANSLATLVRRDARMPVVKVAVRKHIVYLQKAEEPTPAPQTTAAPELHQASI